MNKEITIYELLGLIKDGKAPNRILYDHYIWSWTGDDYHTILKTEKEQFLITGMYYTWVSKFLNDKVEIIEEDNKIKKIQTIRSKWYSEYIKGYFDEEEKYSAYDEYLMNKINELIDKVNHLKENNND